MTLTLALILLTLLAVAAAAHAAKPTINVRISETITATWTCQDQLGEARTPARVSPWALGNRSGVRLLALWIGRRKACLTELSEVKRQWNWQAWLPDKWRRVGICETGLNWHHANSSYVSAFGIQAGSHNGAYDSDAAKVGMPPWTDSRGRHPSPWQQYQTALSHYRSFGGFSGWGCRGA